LILFFPSVFWMLFAVFPLRLAAASVVFSVVLL